MLLIQHLSQSTLRLEEDQMFPIMPWKSCSLVEISWSSRDPVRLSLPTGKAFQDQVGQKSNRRALWVSSAFCTPGSSQMSPLFTVMWKRNNQSLAEPVDVCWTCQVLTPTDVSWNVEHGERPFVPTDFNFWPRRCLYCYINLFPTAALEAFVWPLTSVTSHTNDCSDCYFC